MKNKLDRPIGLISGIILGLEQMGKDANIPGVIDGLKEANNILQKVYDESLPLPAVEKTVQDIVRQNFVVFIKAGVEKRIRENVVIFPGFKKVMDSLDDMTLESFEESVRRTYPDAPEARNQPGEQDEWFDVSKGELPGTDSMDDSCVLIYGCKRGNIQENIAGHCMIASWNGRIWRDDNDTTNIEENQNMWTVTHWRYLPQAPKS